MLKFNNKNKEDMQLKLDLNNIIPRLMAKILLVYFSDNIGRVDLSMEKYEIIEDSYNVRDIIHSHNIAHNIEKLNDYMDEYNTLALIYLEALINTEYLDKIRLREEHNYPKFNINDILVHGIIIDRMKLMDL